MAMKARPARPALSQSEVARRRAAFRKLHRAGCFVIPNPWDIGSARWLQSLGFPAIATTSAGLAFSRGLPDYGALSRDEMLAHIREIVEATNLPVNADFQAGYGDSPKAVAESVRRCIETGVAGLSIEDSTGDPAHPLYDLPEALQRLRAARKAIDASGGGVLLTARAECYLTGHPEPLRESVRRLMAYAEAGADVLYAPGPRERQDIAVIVKAAAPKPVNVLVSAYTGVTVSDLADLGVRRISVGGALARAAWTGFQRAAELIAKQGSFAGLASLTPHAELDRFFSEWKDR